LVKYKPAPLPQREATEINPEDMTGTAAQYLSVRCQYQGHQTLYRWGKNFWQWTGTHYQKIEDEEVVRTSVYQFLKQCVTGRGGWVLPNRNMVNNVLDALEAEAFLDPAWAMPGWLGEGPAPVENLRELVAVRNGLLYLPTRRLFPHTPEFWTPNSLGYSYDPTMRCPRWIQFLEEVWPGDEPAQLALGEMFGLLVTEETRCQKAFMLVGPPRGGRGTIGRVIGGLVGEENLTGSSFVDFMSEFGLEDWIGKKVALFPDAKLEGATKAQLERIAERFQSITGEDKIAVNPKGKKYISRRLNTRVVVLANSLLRFHDNSGALAGRFLIWQMTRTFEGQKDTALTDKLLAELPGILNWALDGLDRLRGRGWEFNQHASGEGLAGALRDLASLIRSFVKDRCALLPTAECTVDDLYSAYRGWCASQGLFAGGKEAFSRDIRAAFPGLHDSRPRKVGGVANEGRKTVLRGICLR
jgi:putative DNA primase/helicase